jgi:xanthine dehydrogenase accessory factor
VTVASARGARADPDQFPNAHRVEGVRAPNVHEVVEAPERTYVVLMSHNLTDDALALESLLKETTVPYVGLMGPRERFEEVREEAAATGTTFTGGELERVSTPVGLDLGGGEPAQIALSIVGEAMAVANGRDGGRLKDREGPIHRRVDA